MIIIIIIIIIIIHVIMISLVAISDTTSNMVECTAMSTARSPTTMTQRQRYEILTRPAFLLCPYTFR